MGVTLLRISNNWSIEIPIEFFTIQFLVRFKLLFTVDAQSISN